VGAFAEAAVVGSAIVQTIESNPGIEAQAVAEFIKQLSAVSRQPSVKTLSKTRQATTQSATVVYR